MRKLLLALPLALGSALGAAAQEAPAGRSPWIETRFHRVHLRNGNFIDGQLIQQTPKNVLLKLQSAGDFSVRRDMISRVEYIKMRSLREEPPLVTPTQPVSALAGPAVKIADPSTPSRRPEAAPAPGFDRVSPATRSAVDDLLLSYALSRPEFRQPLAPRIRALGADAMGYACWVARSGRGSIDRPSLIEAVLEFDHPDAQSTLIAVAASSPDEADRLAAVKALARKDTPEARAALHRAVADSSGEVWRAASEEILKLAEKGQADVELLVGLLQDSPKKALIARLLGQIGSDPAIEALEALLDADVPQDKISAMLALGISGKKVGGGKVLHLIEDADPGMRAETCAFLGRVKHAPAVRSLIEALTDEDETVVKSAHRSLQQITGQTFGPSHQRWMDWWDAGGRGKFPPPQE